MLSDPPPVLVRAVRDGVVESVHRGAVVLATADGEVVGAVGDAAYPTYVRSAAKPFQALATVGVLAEAGVALEPRGLAIACSSHTGSDEHQIEAAYLLARADLDESALRCPPSLPSDDATLGDQRVPTSLAHNCSGKHAGFLFAQVSSGADPRTYLDPATPFQRRVREALESTMGAALSGPGVDGCGAPAYVLPLAGLATGFARLAAGQDGLAVIRDAMRAAPDLVGGEDCPDTALMVADGAVVAKRGAEAVLAAGLELEDGQALGVAVKVEDGSTRAAGPVVATVLAGLGARVPDALRAPPVLGGGLPHGALEVDASAVARVLAKVYPVSNRG
jgi:L-asparaginase II